MKKRFARLMEACHTKQLIRLKRVSKPGRYWDSFVVGLSETFVLLHTLDEGTMTMIGYMALPLDEVGKTRILDGCYFTPRAIELKKITSVPQPDILLLNMPGVLSSVNTHFPLMTLDVEPERDTCYVGRIASLNKKSVILKKMNTAVEWTSLKKFKFSGITCIGFGGGYEEALWMVSENERRIAALLESETEE